MQLTPEEEREILQSTGGLAEKLLSKAGVHVVFPGEKTKSGKNTGETCIVVGVTEKKLKRDIAPSDLVPERLNDKIKTDVIVIPPIYATGTTLSAGYCGGTESTRPKDRNKQGCPEHVYDPETNEPYFNFPGGISIGNANINDAGTLGVMVRDRTTRELVGLSTNHSVGLKPYVPGPHNGVLEYKITDNGYTFVLTNMSTGVSAVSAKMENDQGPYYAGSFDNFLAGDLYKFTSDTNLHDFYISTTVTNNDGGGSIDPYTGITIYTSGGDIRYVNGVGTGTPAISAGEVMYVTMPPSYDKTSVYYGSWLYPNIGNNIDLTFIGVPPCKSTNYKYPPPASEYTDGILDPKYLNIIGNKIGHPANLDVNYHGGTGQILLGHVRSVSPIYFAHPNNNVQPINNCDACTIGLDPRVAQASHNVLGLTSDPLVSSNSWVGGVLFKSGRTTGVSPSGTRISPTGIPVGNARECKITSTSAIISVNYCPNHGAATVQSSAVFKDCLLYTLQGEWFSDSGDSGAALLIRDPTAGDTLKLTGMHFAGSFKDDNTDNIPDSPVSTFGVGARIQNVFEELNLTNWEGTIIAPVDDNCIKVDGDCYVRSDSTLVRPTHRTVDEIFDDCDKCTND
jgi:hypothetical protein